MSSEAERWSASEIERALRAADAPEDSMATDEDLIRYEGRAEAVEIMRDMLGLARRAAARLPLHRTEAGYARNQPRRPADEDGLRAARVTALREAARDALHETRSTRQEERGRIVADWLRDRADRIEALALSSPRRLAEPRTPGAEHEEGQA